MNQLRIRDTLDGERQNVIYKKTEFQLCKNILPLVEGIYCQLIQN